MDYNAITIDTNIFEEKDYNFEEGVLSSLKQFAKTKKIDFIISEVVLKEIENHLLKKSQEAHLSFCKALGDTVFYGLKKDITKKEVKDLKRQDITPIVMERIENFKNSTKLILLSSESVDSNELLTKYFNSEPPFGKTEKKKSEFPDAIALLSLENLAKSNNKKILVVSKDKDWNCFCKKSSLLDCRNDLAQALEILNEDHFLTIEVIRGLLEDYEGEFSQKLKNEIAEMATYIEADVEANSYLSYNIDYTSVEYNDFEYKYDYENNLLLNMVEVDDNIISISIPVIYDLVVDAEFDLYVYDSIDKEDISLGRCHRSFEKKLETNVVIEIEFDKENPEKSEINNTYLENTVVYAQFEDLDLSDEEEYSDYHEEHLISKECK